MEREMGDAGGALHRSMRAGDLSASRNARGSNARGKDADTGKCCTMREGRDRMNCCFVGQA